MSSFESKFCGLTALCSEIRPKKRESQGQKPKTITEVEKKIWSLLMGRKINRRASRRLRGENSHDYITWAARCFFRSPVSVSIYFLGFTKQFYPHGGYFPFNSAVWVTKYSFHLVNSGSICDLVHEFKIRLSQRIFDQPQRDFPELTEFFSHFLSCVIAFDLYFQALAYFAK